MSSDDTTMRIAVCALAASGHLMPMLNIAEALCGRGHEVHFFTFHFVEGKIGPAVAKFGGNFVPIVVSPFESDEDFRVEATKRSIFRYIVDNEAMAPPLVAALRMFRPHVVVADVMTAAAADAAREVGAPLVINVPGPLANVKVFLGDPDFERSLFNLGGLSISYVSVNALKFAVTTNVMNLRKYAGILRTNVSNSILLVNTFYGLEEPGLLMSNVVLTGSLLPRPGALNERLASQHPKLYAFLGAGRKPVVYVSTGSMALLTAWQVSAIFHGLKALDCRVVWSLKAELQPLLPAADDPAFWVDAWVPQMEVLSHEAVLAVITHCGWGGTLECISGAKPVISIPFFGDQSNNAELLAKRGVAEPIAPAPPLSFDETSNGYKENAFTAESVYRLVGKVLGDPKYEEAAKRLQALNDAAGGARRACEAIELAGTCGVDHLKIDTVVKRVGGQTPLVITLCVLGTAAASVGLAALALKRLANAK